MHGEQRWSSLFPNSNTLLIAESRAKRSRLTPKSKKEHVPYHCEVRQESHFVSIIVRDNLILRIM